METMTYKIPCRQIPWCRCGFCEIQTDDREYALLVLNDGEDDVTTKA